jgi:protein-tyrosine phosphatase
MIDLHSHILPGLDDGARDFPEAMAMCRIAVEDGIETIAATPHAYNGSFVSHVADVRALTEKLNARVRERGMRLHVVPGMEVRITPDYEELLKSGMLLPINEGKYILSELDPFNLPAGLDKLIRRIWGLGYGMILVHPERNMTVQRSPGLLAELVSKFTSWELLIQVSSDSLTGEAGQEAKRAAATLLKRGLVRNIASDAHSPFFRPPCLSFGVKAAEEIIGAESVLPMVTDVPRAVLEGKGFPDNLPQPDVRRWWKIR